MSEQTSTESSDPTGGPGGPRVCVLVVEPNAAARKRVRDALPPWYALRFAASVQEALDAIAESRPDLVVSEVELADSDGFQLCRLLRRQSELRELPILLLTTRASTADKVRGFQAGADDYVVKPFDDRVFQARLRLLSRIKSIEPPALLGEVS